MSLPGSPLRALLEASANSPLAEADPKSLDELMRRAQATFNIPASELLLDSPETNAAIATNVLYFRHQRARFSQLAHEKAEKDATKPRRGPAKSFDEAIKRQKLLDAV